MAAPYNNCPKLDAGGRGRNRYFRAASRAAMVMPLVDEDDPKCYVCHRRFRTLDELREHQSGERAAAAADAGAAKRGAPPPPPPTERGPAPGDVSMF